MEVPREILDAFKEGRNLKKDFSSVETFPNGKRILFFGKKHIIEEIDGNITIYHYVGLNYSFVEEFPGACFRFQFPQKGKIDIWEYDTSRIVIFTDYYSLLELLEKFKKNNKVLNVLGLEISYHNHSTPEIDIESLICKFIISDFRIKFLGNNPHLIILKFITENNLQGNILFWELIYKTIKKQFPNLLEIDHPLWEYNRFELAREFLKIQVKSARNVF